MPPPPPKQKATNKIYHCMMSAEMAAKNGVHILKKAESMWAFPGNHFHRLKGPHKGHRDTAMHGKIPNCPIYGSSNNFLWKYTSPMRTMCLKTSLQYMQHNGQWAEGESNAGGGEVRQHHHANPPGVLPHHCSEPSRKHHQPIQLVMSVYGACPSVGYSAI